MRSFVHLIAVAVAVVAAAAPVRAQTFPTGLSPLYCARGVMTDGYRDGSGAVDERDLVGTPAQPAGFRAIDAQFLYLRLRLDASPAQGNGLRPFAWGFELSTDGDPTTYEVLIAVDGAAGTVSLYRNTVTTVPDSPADPADQPPVMTYPFAKYGRVVDAGASLFGGGNDSFLDLAVPWSDLSAVGLTPTTVVTLWAASSSNPDRLNGDFACQDGAGGTALPSLSSSGSGPIAADPSRSPGPVGGTDTDGGGNLIGGSGIEGGPGCSCALDGGHRARWWGVLLAGAGVWVARRRRRADPRQAKADGRSRTGCGRRTICLREHA